MRSLHAFRFVLSESVRPDKEDRMKAIVTTEGVYFVRARGTPSPESIVLLVRFSELYVCQPLSSGRCSKFPSFIYTAMRSYVIPHLFRILTYFTADVAPTGPSNTPQLCQPVRFYIRRRTQCLFYFYFFVDGKDYIELVMKADNSSVPTPSRNPSKRPRVRCDQRMVAHKVGNNGCRKLGIVILCITVKFALR